MKNQNIHVVPVNDLIEHDSDKDSFDSCICGPEVEYVINGNFIIKHHSLDGREFHEHVE